MATISSETLIEKIVQALQRREETTITVGEESFRLIQAHSLAYGDNDGGWYFDLYDSDLLNAEDLSVGARVEVFEMWSHRSGESHGKAQVVSLEMDQLRTLVLDFEDGHRHTFRSWKPAQLWIQPECDSMLAWKGTDFGFKKC